MNSLKTMSQIMAMAVLIFTAVSCNTTDNSDPQLNLIPINSVTVDGYTISLESPSELEVGSNYLFWKIEQDGEVIKPQSFTIQPMMDMGEMEHSTPFEQPETALEDENYLKNLVAFSMPSGSMGSWAISFNLFTQTDEEISGEIPIDVNPSWRMTSVKSDSGQTYYITWHVPQKPVSGLNDLSFWIHTSKSMMSYPPVEDAELIIYPFMDMGGGSGHSTPFTAPDATGNGFYEGDINYSMSGDWTTSVQLIVENDTLPEVRFEYHVQAK